MKRTIWFVVIVVGILVGIPALVYAMDYKDEYEVKVTFTVTSEEYASATVSDVQTDSKPLGILSFWDVLLKGHPGASAIANFNVWVSLTQGTDTKTEMQSVIVTYPSGSEDMIFEFSEMKAGETTLRIYIEHTYTDTGVYDYSWTVNIG